MYIDVYVHIMYVSYIMFCYYTPVLQILFKNHHSILSNTFVLVKHTHTQVDEN